MKPRKIGYKSRKAEGRASVEGTQSLARVIVDRFNSETGEPEGEAVTAGNLIAFEQRVISAQETLEAWQEYVADLKEIVKDIKKLGEG